jgi:uncharacterized membrane protein
MPIPLLFSSWPRRRLSTTSLKKLGQQNARIVSTALFLVCATAGIVYAQSSPCADGETNVAAETGSMLGQILKNCPGHRLTKDGYFALRANTQRTEAKGRACTAYGFDMLSSRLKSEALFNSLAGSSREVYYSAVCLFLTDELNAKASRAGATGYVERRPNL